MKVSKLLYSLIASLFISTVTLAQGSSNNASEDNVQKMTETLQKNNPFSVDVSLVESLMPVFKIVLAILFIIILWKAGEVFWSFLAKFVSSARDIITGDKVETKALKDLGLKALIAATVIALVVIFVSGNFMNVIIAIIKVGNAILDKVVNAFTTASTQVK